MLLEWLTGYIGCYISEENYRTTFQFTAFFTFATQSHNGRLTAFFPLLSVELELQFMCPCPSLYRLGHWAWINIPLLYIKSGYQAPVPLLSKLAARIGAYFQGVLIFKVCLFSWVLIDTCNFLVASSCVRGSFSDNFCPMFIATRSIQQSIDWLFPPLTHQRTAVGTNKSERGFC